MTLSYLWAKLLKKIRGSAIINSKIDKTSVVNSGCHIVSSSFGKYSYCGYDCDIISTDIGNFVSIAANCKMGGAMHVMDWASMSPVFYYGRDSIKKKFSVYRRPSNNRVLIGHDVWIGEGCIIKQGVTIGVGSVIGMGSIVTKNIPPYSIAAGNPARVIRQRFPEEIASSLLASKWWELDDDSLKVVAKYIQEPVSFISAVNQIRGN